MAIALIVLPVAGIAWIGWTERWRRVAEDVRVFLRAAPRRKSRERLAEIRATVVDAFDRVAELL